MADLNLIFSQRLRQARLISKLSLRELSDAMDNRVSYNALSRYEKGEMMPGGEVLASLSEALNQPADFFFRTYRVELAKIEFRKRQKLSSSEEDAVLERSRDFFERYCEVEQIVDSHIAFSPLTHKDLIRTEEQAEGAADQLRKEWKLGEDPLKNVHELIELHGIKVHEAETEDEAFDGFSGTANGAPVVVIAKWLNKNVPRKRWTEVHELAHLVLHVPEELSLKEKERIANRFTGALLLPKEPFVKMFGQHRHTISLGELIQIKAFFGVSIMAIMKRAEQLGLISKPIYERFCIITSKQKWRSAGEPGDKSYTGSETHGRFRQLVFRAVGDGLISSSKGAGYLKMNLDEFRGHFQQLFA